MASAAVSMLCLSSFLSLLTIGSSGTLIGLSYNNRGNVAESALTRTLSFLKQNNISETRIRVFVSDRDDLTTLASSTVSADFYLHESQVGELLNSKACAISFLRNSIAKPPRIRSVVLSGIDQNLWKILSTLELIHSNLRSFGRDEEVKVSVAFSVLYLKKMNSTQKHDLYKILEFIRRTRSFVVVEDTTDVERMGTLYIESMIHKATDAVSLLPRVDVPLVVTIKSLKIPTAKEVAEFAVQASSFMFIDRFSDRVVELYADVSSMDDFVKNELEREREKMFPHFRRQLLNESKVTLHDATNPPAVFPTNPVTTPSVIPTPDNPTPTVVTIPATNPVAQNPANPVPTPSSTPVTAPPTNPTVTPTVPITNPVTTPAPIAVPGTQPVTNPATTYPPTPAGNVPAMNPVTPVTPPSTTNAPAIPGQSWCVAKSGVPETTLQSALDYACGMGGTDCSAIQQGGSCYNPNTLQNHASYAFNSYYQKNPVATSCDFGGAASIVNANPSTGSCNFPSSSSSSSPSTSTPAPSTSSTTNPVTTPTPTTVTPTPTIPPPTPTTATPLPGADTGSSSMGAPPSVLNSSTPGSGSTVFDTPPAINSSPSESSAAEPLISLILLLSTSAVTMLTILHI